MVEIDLHPWSESALFSKTLVYVDQMESVTVDDWRYGLWSSLAIEFLGRAALSHISPVLLADGDNWRNSAFAIGLAPTTKKFRPISIPIAEVVKRLEELIPEFGREHADFCAIHANRRNEELHTGSLSFSGLGTSLWLADFYGTCQILLESMGRNISELFSNPSEVIEIIDSKSDETAKAVNKDISAYRQVWQNLEQKERERLKDRSSTMVSRRLGHVVDCPACLSRALLSGSPSGAVSTSIDDGEVVQKQTMMPTSFECKACGLKIDGLSKLSACNLGDAFTGTTTISPSEYFELYTEEDLEEVRREFRYADADFND